MKYHQLLVNNKTNTCSLDEQKYVVNISYIPQILPILNWNIDNKKSRLLI